MLSFQTTSLSAGLAPYHLLLFVLTWSSPAISAPSTNLPGTNNAVIPCGLSGATIDAQIANAFAALPSSQGTVDATCYGTSTQLEAGPIAVGPGQYLKLSNATYVRPASASSAIATVTQGSSLDGLHMDLSTYATSYSGPGISYPCVANQSGPGPIITNIVLDGATYGPGNALNVTSSIDGCGIQQTIVRNLSSTGLNNPIVLNATAGLAWINGNEFHDLKLTGSTTAGQHVTCISLLNNGFEIIGNIFDGLCEGWNVSGSIGVSASQPSGSYNVSGNVFNMNIYDTTDYWYIPAASAPGGVVANWIQGYLNGVTNDTSQRNTIINFQPGGGAGAQDVAFGSVVSAPWFNSTNPYNILAWENNAVINPGGWATGDLTLKTLAAGDVVDDSDAVSGWAPHRSAYYIVAASGSAGNTVIPAGTTGYHGLAGTDTKVQLSDGTGTSGPAAFDANGGLTTAPAGIATLSSGTVTVSTAAACTASSACVYKLTNCGLNSSSAIGTPTIGTVTAGTSFVINSESSTAAIVTGDKSFVCWQIN